MKKLFSVLFIVITMVGCQQERNAEPQKGGLVFSLSNKTKGNPNGRTDGTTDPASVIITIKDANGNYVAQNKKITLYNFGKSYTTESIDLAVGDYKVTQFWVLNADNTVLYVSPVEGSDQAKLVVDPLPVDFHITKDGSTAVEIEVLDLSETSAPEDFGYASFSFHVVQQDINLTFIASTNPFMTTDGYKTVIVTFTSGQTVIQKELTVISPVEARGTIKPTELGLPNSGQAVAWTAKISASYESIDEVPYDLHINEAITSVTLSIAPDTKLIKFEGSKVNLTKGTTVYDSKDLAWENWSHLTDETGYFHFLVKNDICYPVFKYDIKKSDVYYLFYEKGVNGTKADGSNFSDSRYKEIYNEDFSHLSAGSFTDSETFANLCPSQISGTMYGYYYFSLSADGGDAACYIVWEYKDTPIDPNAPDGVKTKVGNFKILSEEGMAKLKNPTGGRKSH